MADDLSGDGTYNGIGKSEDTAVTTEARLGEACF